MTTNNNNNTTANATANNPWSKTPNGFILNDEDANTAIDIIVNNPVLSSVIPNGEIKITSLGYISASTIIKFIVLDLVELNPQEIKLSFKKGNEYSLMFSIVNGNAENIKVYECL